MGLLARARSEYAYLAAALRILQRLKPVAEDNTRTFPDALEELAAKHGDRVALLSHRESLTYRQLLERSNQYAHWALEQGLGKGDTVALMIGGRPEYLAVWMGLIRIGVVAALLNINQTGKALAHSVNIVGAKRILCDSDLLPQIAEAEPLFESEIPVFVSGTVPRDRMALEPQVDSMPTGPIPLNRTPALTIEDPALYIYTSGTTGLPKAAIINHYRIQAIMNGFSAVCDARPDDRIYVAQPLYHTAGGVLAPGIALMAGGSCFIREKFSARQFWDDIVEYDCTMFQYIGELCRYLLNAPPNPNETRHRIRLADGNGLRPDIWEAFQSRFRIPHILEWYAATEGNVTLFNVDGRPGSVGRIPWWLERRFPVKIVRFDMEAQEPVRGPDGFCTECAPDEIGEGLGKILIDPNAPAQRFDGYADREATERKILRDVFETGDAWFRTGDLMKKDRRGYFFFIDRIGDTFRWKGENVATSQVGETIATFPGIRDANVYGVEVPGHEGRAGMATLVAEEGLDLAGLHAHLERQLPAYAQPLFLRLRPEADVTTTFKQRKVDLRKEGFDPAEVPDDLYFNDLQNGLFRPLDETLHADIVAGRVRL